MTQARPLLDPSASGKEIQWGWPCPLLYDCLAAQGRNGASGEGKNESEGRCSAHMGSALARQRCARAARLAVDPVSRLPSRSYWPSTTPPQFSRAAESVRALVPCAGGLAQIVRGSPKDRAAGNIKNLGPNPEIVPRCNGGSRKEDIMQASPPSRLCACLVRHQVSRVHSIFKLRSNNELRSLWQRHLLSPACLPGSHKYPYRFSRPPAQLPAPVKVASRWPQDRFQNI